MSNIIQSIPRIYHSCFPPVVKTGHGNSYKLLEKIESSGIDFAKKSFELRAPKDADLFTYVKVGDESNKDFSREIISFFDRQKRLIMSYFRQDGKNVAMKSYKYKMEMRTIDTFDFDATRLPPDMADNVKMRNICGRWVKKFTEHQIVRNVFGLHKGDKDAKKLFVKRIDYDPTDSSRQRMTFTEFPINLGFGKKSDKKVICADVFLTNNDITLSNISHTPNFSLDNLDEFLKYRFIDPRTDEGIRYLTRDLLREKNLDCLNIYIAPSSYKVSKNSSGHFSAADREICFSPAILDVSTSKAVDVSAHEVEHAYQHALIGRIGSGRTRYETEAMQKLGSLPVDESKNAVEYAIANNNYPRLSDTENLRENPLYWGNKLEVDARKAGTKAAERFEDSSNYEFFDEFYEY